MIFASNNEGKIKEVKMVLKNYNIYSLKDKNIDIEVEEDVDTFLGNAKKKAIEIYNITHEEVIADDSGLCVDCLDGFPGVMTHRFLGDDSTPEMRNEYLINEVNKHSNRGATFVCNMVYYNGKEIIVGEGILNGTISKECRGENGFGFDRIFEFKKRVTLGEISLSEKNRIGARALALKDLKKKLDKYRK